MHSSGCTVSEETIHLQITNQKFLSNKYLLRNHIGRIAITQRRNFQKGSKQHLTPSPHFRKIVLQFFFFNFHALKTGNEIVVPSQILRVLIHYRTKILLTSILKNFIFWCSTTKLGPNLVKVLILDKTIFCCNLWRLLCVCRPSQGIMSIIINRHQATIAQLLTKSTPLSVYKWFQMGNDYSPQPTYRLYPHLMCRMSGDRGHSLNFLSW